MEDLKITKLFSGFKIKKVSLKNRIVFLPHYHGLSSIEGLPTQVEIDYYVDLECGEANNSSTVIKIINNKFSIIRQGEIAKEEIIKKIPNLIFSYNQF